MYNFANEYKYEREDEKRSSLEVRKEELVTLECKRAKIEVPKSVW